MGSTRPRRAGFTVRPFGAWLVPITGRYQGEGVPVSPAPPERVAAAESRLRASWFDEAASLERLARQVMKARPNAARAILLADKVVPHLLAGHQAGWSTPAQDRLLERVRKYAHEGKSACRFRHD